MSKLGYFVQVVSCAVTVNFLNYRMRIVHFHPDKFASERFVVPLVRRELELGHRSSLFTDAPASERKSFRTKLNLVNILFFPVTLIRLILMLKRERADVVFAHNTTGALIPLFASKLSGVNERIYFNHGVPSLGQGFPVSSVLKFLELVNIFFATKVITVSTDMVGALKEISSRVSPQLISSGSAAGIDRNIFTPNIVYKSSWRSQHGFESSDILFCFVGRPERRKGFHFIVELWCKKFHGVSPPLILIGPVESDLKRVVKVVPANIHCLGYVKDIENILPAMDVLLLPSLHEGLPYSILEAQACGLTVVSNDIQGVRNLITDGANGFLIETQNEEKYVERIKLLADDMQLIRKIGKKGRDSVGTFCREEFFKHYQAFLTTLIKG